MATPYRPDDDQPGDDRPGWVIPPPPGTGPQPGGQGVPGYGQVPTAPQEPAGPPAYGPPASGPAPYGPPAPGPGPEQGEPYAPPLDARPYATGETKRRVPKRALLIAGGAAAAAVLVGVSAAAVVAANKREYATVAEDRAGGAAPAPAEATSPGQDGVIGTPSAQRTPKAKRTRKQDPDSAGRGGRTGGSDPGGRTPIPAGFIKDDRAGLAYPGKGSPWFRADDFGAYRASWTSYQKRQVSREPDYYAEIGAGRLPGDIGYSGSGSLRSATEVLAKRYLNDRGLYPSHNLTGVVSSARTVDGRRAWYYSAVLKFPQAADEGWSWKSERMALLTVHLPGRRPGTMFTTIPDVLRTSTGTDAISAARVL